MLGAEAYAYYASGNAAEEWIAVHQLQWERKSERFVAGECCPNDRVLNSDLKLLGGPRGEMPAALHDLEFVFGRTFVN